MEIRMKTSQIILKLQSLQKEYGDLNVNVKSNECDSDIKKIDYNKEFNEIVMHLD